MKTFRQLIDELPEPVRSQALANMDPYELGDEPEVQTAPGFLSFAFFWENTPEGWQYWRDACDGKFEQPAALKLAVGKKYRTRDGREAGITGEDSAYSLDSLYRFDGEVEGEAQFCWAGDGRFEIRESPLDLVEEIIDTPAPAPAPAPKNNLQELFNRLPEPWRSKAVSNCEAWYERPLEEIPLSLSDKPGFGFLGYAFTWTRTPEGSKVWGDISVRGVFPPEGEPEEDDTPRIADLERRVAALEDRLTESPVCCEGVWTELPVTEENSPEEYRFLEASEVIEKGDEYRTTRGCPVGTKREDCGWEPVTPGSIGEELWSTDVGHYRRPIKKPATVDPGEGYRLVEIGELIETGDEWLQDNGTWQNTCFRTGDGCKLNIDAPLRRKLAPERYPTTPLPEGFDRWECRGLGWCGAKGAHYTTGYPGDRPRWDDSVDHGPSCGFDTLEYWEAVKDTPPAPQAYRLLNPGELIEEGDELLDGINLAGPEKWRRATSSRGLAYNPEDHFVTRRPLKTYEDA